MIVHPDVDPGAGTLDDISSGIVSSSCREPNVHIRVSFLASAFPFRSLLVAQHVSRFENVLRVQHVYKQLLEQLGHDNSFHRASGNAPTSCT